MNDDRNLLQNPFLCDIAGTDFQIFNDNYFALIVQFERFVSWNINPTIFQLCILASSKNIYLLYEYIQIFYKPTGPYPQLKYSVDGKTFSHLKSGLSSFKDILNGKSCSFNKNGQFVARVARANIPVTTRLPSTAKRSTTISTSTSSTNVKLSQWSSWYILVECMSENEKYVRVYQRNCDSTNQLCTGKC